MSQPAETQTADDEPPTPDTLRTHLQSLAARLGKTPTVVDVHNDSQVPFQPDQYIDAFGDWNNALRDAGLDPDTTTQKLTDHELLAELQRLYSEQGSPPTCDDMREEGEYSDKVYKNRFGSWNDALQAAMLDTNEISDRELLQELVRVAYDLDCIPTADEMRDHGEYRPVTYHRRFGSWRQALATADFSRK